MEVLSAATSIAGLLSLAGQCISGAQNLLKLYQDIVAASSTIETFAKDINSLLRTLYDVKDLLENIQIQIGELNDEIPLTTLKLQLEDCDQVVSSWLKTAQSHKRDGGKGAASYLRRLWLAMNKDSVKRARADIQKKRVELAIALSILGRAFDVQLAASTRAIAATAVETHANTQSLLDHSTNANDALMRLETISVAMSDELGSMKSLMSSLSSTSARSPFSNTENHQDTSPSRGWRCDAWSSIMDLFRTSTQSNGFASHEYLIEQCGFCGHRFPIDWNAAASSYSGAHIEHLKYAHKLFSCCEIAECFSRMELFHDHIIAKHDAELGRWTMALDRACFVGKGDIAPSPCYERFAKNRDSLSHAKNVEEQDAEDPEATDQSLDVHTLQSSSWDANLLGDFVSSRDRINRWILHMLGAHSRQTAIHRMLYSEVKGHAPKLDERSWNRLVLKHWFVDEAATGLNADEIIASGVDEEINVVNSSLYLSARPSAARRSDVLRPATELPQDEPEQSSNAIARPRKLEKRSRDTKKTWRRIETERMADVIRVPFPTNNNYASSRASGGSMGSINERLHWNGSEEENDSHLVFAGNVKRERDLAAGVALWE